jgi:hypothetical protein
MTTVKTRDLVVRAAVPHLMAAQHEATRSRVAIDGVKARVKVKVEVEPQEGDHAAIAARNFPFQRSTAMPF